ncbi:ribonuclease E/G [Alphaproteobacteria bacterium LSUCC0684]
MASTRIIVDRLAGYTRTALLKDNLLTDLFIDDADDLAPGPGAVLRARVERVFPDHDRVSLDIGGIPASMRNRGGKAVRPGEMILATVAAEAREKKPLQLRRGLFRAGRYVMVEDGAAERRLSRGLRETGYMPPDDLLRPLSSLTITLRRAVAGADPSWVKAEFDELVTWAESILDLPSSGPAILAPAITGIEEARLVEPDAEMVMDDDGSAWEEAGIDEALEAALAPTVFLAGGGAIHISTPPGAAVIDGDSGDDALAPMQLARAMVPEVARQIRLRRIGGPVVIDFPRLGAKDRRQIADLMDAAVQDDPCRPRCHGFTEGGLFTLTRPWRWRSLAVHLAPSPARIGRDALRLLRRNGARRPHHPLEICLPPAGLEWLEGPGALSRAKIEEGLVFAPRFRSDSTLDHAFVQDMAPKRKG